jgi:hypothetical protein
VKALPALREALCGDDVQIAIEAAECIAKLGPAAKEAAEEEGGTELEWQLYVIGSKVWSYSLYANCYSACLNALQKIEADDDFIVEYVSHNIGLSGDDDLIESLRALAAINNEESIDLLKRAITFWQSKMKSKTRKEADKIQAAL